MLCRKCPVGVEVQVALDKKKKKQSELKTVAASQPKITSFFAKKTTTRPKETPSPIPMDWRRT